MKLHGLIATIPGVTVVGNPDSEVSSLTQNTREAIEPNALYFAVVGATSDGHTYIDEAIEKGARTIFCERLPEELHEGVTYAVVDEVAPWVGVIASTFYGNPSQEITVIGVTGTNGKTTIATTLYHLLQSFGKKTILLSTAGDYYNGEAITVERHAPSSVEPITFHRLLAQYKNEGAEYCCIEVTSHAAAQDRIAGTDIDVALFTNLTQDHLDYHGTIEHYASSKKKFFDMLDTSACAIVNTDDSYADMMVRDTQATIVSYGTSSDANYSFSVKRTEATGTEFDLNGEPMHINQLGLFNVYNTVAAVACLDHLGFDAQEVRKRIGNVDSVKGRMEVHASPTGVVGIVDYAHSPDALLNVLSTLNALPHESITTVFGCGGDRDRGKRPLMASVVERYSDTIIVTNDNPRTESEEQIFDDISKGFSEDTLFTVISDREEAIRKAVQEAKKGTIILIAGKGHENYQIVGTEKRYFSDMETLEKAFIDFS